MRISHETLMKLANDQVAQRAKKELDVIAVYLYGSLLGDDPLIAGTGDLDLAFVHSNSLPEWREIVRITDDIHLDINHTGRDMYRTPRDLRVNPWMGPVVYGCKILYDPQHFMDFVQASVRGQFSRPDNVMERARKQLEHARQIWFDLQLASTPDPEIVGKYFRSLDHAANAIASLSGPPLGERRFLQRLVERSNQAGQPALVGKLLGLIGGQKASVEMLQKMLPDWQTAYRAVENPPARLHIHRLGYYQKAFDFFLSAGQPFQAVLWPLLRTWTTAASLLPETEQQSWQNALDQLGLVGDGFADCVHNLDDFLDQVEDALDAWSKKAGA